MNNLQHELQKAAIRHQQEIAEKKKDETVEILIRVMSAAYDKSTTYSNLIMIGGFASFFAVWTKLYETNKTNYMTMSGLLMLSSVTIFIVWELYKMIFYSTNLRALFKVTEEPDPKTFFEKLGKTELKEKRRQLTQTKIWIFVLIVTIIPGLTAVGFLLYSIINELIKNFA